MPNNNLRALAPKVFSGSFTDVDTTKKHILGTKAADASGNVYRYVQGCTNGAANKVVTFDELFATALITANAVGQVGVMQAALNSTSTYGWVLVEGTCQASCDTIAADKACFIDGTDGRVDDAVVTGDLICGMWSRSADTSNLCTVQLNNPFVTDVLG